MIEKSCMVKILLIDDNKENLYTLSQILLSLIPDCSILTSGTGKEGLYLAKTKLPDTILLDIQMPEMDGFEVLRKLKSNIITNHIPVILITANYTDTDSKIRGLESGADAFIAKPIDKNELAAHVKSMLRIKAAEDKIRLENLKLSNSLKKESESKDLIKNNYQNLYNNINDLVCTHDLDGNILSLNLSIEKNLGYPENEILHKNIKDYLAPEVKNQFDDYLNEIKKNGTSMGQMLIQTASGEKRIWEYNNSLIKTINGEIFVSGISRDITERKKMEKELIKAKENAEEMNRIKSSFLANMSHELRTPLIGILGYSQVLQEETNMSEVKYMADTIYSSGQRLLQTLNQVLDLSSIEANKNQLDIAEFNISDIVSESVKLFKPFAKNKNITLETIIRCKSPIVNSDERLIFQMLNNLVNNAIKFTNVGGVKVEVDKEKINKKQFITLKVIDTGIGISQENQKIIFEEFRQASEGYSREFEGTGLGLTIVKKFSNLMNIEILLNSEKGKGSTFKLLFPLSAKNIKGIE